MSNRCFLLAEPRAIQNPNRLESLRLNGTNEAELEAHTPHINPKNTPLTPIRTETDVMHGLARLLELDPGLKPLAKIAGALPLRLQEPGFAGLSRIVIGQHVSTASAGAIHARFINEVTPVTPQAWLATAQEVRIAIGLTRAKQATLDSIASSIVSGELDLNTIGSLDAQEAIARLTRLKGVGPWTADVYLLFCEGHPDIFAAGDLAIREAARLAFDMDERPSENSLRQIANDWAPYRGIASRLFWTYYEKLKQSKRAVL